MLPAKCRRNPALGGERIFSPRGGLWIQRGTEARIRGAEENLFLTRAFKAIVLRAKAELLWVFPFGDVGFSRGKPDFARGFT
jgi:hypothetical protein